VSGANDDVVSAEFHPTTQTQLSPGETEFLDPFLWMLCIVFAQQFPRKDAI